MSNVMVSPTPLSRVTCCVHHQLSQRITRELRHMGLKTVMVESGRNVRRHIHRPRLRISRRIVRTEDSPVDIFRFDVPRDLEEQVLYALIDSVEMSVPGRGTVFTQEVREYVSHTAQDIALDHIPEGEKHILLGDLALMTCILSASGSGERLAELALELGTGVPIVTLGVGTGMRDRLGLLRITVPPEKELVHLLVPAFDTEGLVRQVIEEGRLNGPGRGFVYSSTVRQGVLDTRLKLGPQEHAASMEQVVAALDKLNRSTAWRRRFSTEDTAAGYQLSREFVEIAIVCAEERSGIFVDAAQQAGARGATSARIRRIGLDESAPRDAARERCIMTVHSSIRDAVIHEVLTAAEKNPEWLDSLQVLDAPIAYSYQGGSTRRE